MDGIVKILGIPNSLRRRSFIGAALRAAQDRVPADATREIFDLDGVPPFSKDGGIAAALPHAVAEFQMIVGR